MSDKKTIFSKGKFQLYKLKVKRLKKEIYTLALVYKDPRTPWYIKALVVLVVGYALSPIDVIPDFIPVLGYIDDFIILPVCIFLIIKMVPKEIMDDCRAKADRDLLIKKEKHWLAGIVIVLIWILVALWFVSLFFD